MQSYIVEEMMKQMRSTVIMAGAIIGRFKEAIFSYPGDCDIWWIHRTRFKINEWIRKFDFENSI